MSFVRIGDRIINLMAVTHAAYVPGGLSESMLRIFMVGGHEDRIEYYGSQADELWAVLSRMSTPWERFIRASDQA